MSDKEIRPSTIQDLDLVHNLVEQCLQLHLSRRDATDLILREAKIDPSFTELVWNQLEEENKEFFEAYYIRLALKKQVQHFNDLLGQQVALMQQITIGAAPSPGSNCSHISGNGYSMPENGSHGHVNGPINASNNKSPMPFCQANVFNRPENGSHGAVNGSSGTINASNMPINGSPMPENASTGQANAFIRPVNGSCGSINGSNQPAYTSNMLGNGSHRPINGFNGSIDGSYRAVNGSHRPPNVYQRAESGSNMQSFVQNGSCYSTDEAGPSTRSQNLLPTLPSNIAMRSQDLLPTLPSNIATRSHNLLPTLPSNIAMRSQNLLPTLPSNIAMGSQNLLPTLPSNIMGSQNLLPTLPSNMPSAFTNGMSMMQMPTPFDLSTPCRGIEFLNTPLHNQSSNYTGLIQGLNEKVITSGSVFPDSQHIFQTNGNVIGTHTTMGSEPFSSVESSSQNESLLATDRSLFGKFGQNIQDMNLSGMSTSYSNTLANFANSGFASGDVENFLVYPNGAQVPEDTNGRLSESFDSYEDLRID